MQISYNTIGRAYEYAWLEVLDKELSALRKTRIISNSSLRDNKRAWDNLEEMRKNKFIASAQAAVETILRLEPLMSVKGDDELLLEFQSDDLGVLGDVRDIVIKRPSLGWEVGLSIKHNHEAIKHSRLSYGLDFAKEWFGNPCSWEYWQEVKPLFDRLKDEKKRGSKWSELPDKESGVYIPLLKAFMADIKRAAKAYAAMPQKMVEYLIGTKDYYKIISYDKNQTTVIRTFNIHNTLAVQADQAIPTVQLPTKIVDLKFRSWGNNTVEMHLNNGWSLSFRIHNASAKVEPSLKFDVQFLKMPASILSFTHRWK